MRKLTILSIICILLIPCFAFATDWHKVDQATFGWDAPVNYADGTPLPADISLSYRIWTKNPGGGEVNVVGVVNELVGTVTLAPGDKKYLGVSAYYVDSDGIESPESTISWSDDPIDCKDGVTFGVHNLKRPDKPENLYK